MKKLIGLLVAVVMVMGLATTAFAAPVGQYLTPVDGACTLDPALGTALVQIEAEGMVTVTMSGVSAGNVSTYGYYGDDQLAADYTVLFSRFEQVPAQNGEVSGALSSNQIMIMNTTSASIYVMINVEAGSGPAVGTLENPAELTIGSNEAPVPEFDAYYYTLTAPQDGVLVLNCDDPNWFCTIQNKTAMIYPDAIFGDEGKTVATVEVNAGDEIEIAIATCDYSAATINFTAAIDNPVGSKNNPIEVDAAGDYVVEGDKVWYAVNSRLAGYIIVATGDNASIVVGDDTINAVDGVATAVLNGEGAVIPVVVSNATDMIIMAAPVEIDAAGDYTADVAAGAEVEYAVNSKLAGAILTVEGEGAYILIGTSKYEAVDGVATAVLDGTGATIAVKVGNAGEAAAQYALNIAYAPTAINAAGDYTANVGAGAEVEYVVNSKLAGAILTVKGEGAYIVMGDTKVTAVDGVASVVLDGTGATIAVKVGNAGDAAAEYALNIAYAPAAINAVGDYTADVPAAGEVEYLVNSKLDGAVVTVKGEGAYLVVNGTKVEGKDGVVTATLKAEGATISLKVGNAGTAAAQYTVNVALPASNPATGDMGVVMSVAALAMSAFGGVALVAKKKEF